MDSTIEKHHCACEYKRSLVSQMLKMREDCPEKCTEWVDILYPKHIASDGDSYCCLLTLMFYYGYCKSCSTPMSEYAKNMLAGLMDDYPSASRTVS